jgi:hypothetical protein
MTGIVKRLNLHMDSGIVYHTIEYSWMNIEISIGCDIYHKSQIVNGVFI